MVESDKRKCKVCGTVKNRILAGKFSTGKHKRYVNEEGENWHGRTCPACHQERMKNHMKQLRTERKVEKS